VTDGGRKAALIAINALQVALNRPTLLPLHKSAGCLGTHIGSELQRRRRLRGILCSTRRANPRPAQRKSNTPLDKLLERRQRRNRGSGSCLRGNIQRPTTPNPVCSPDSPGHAGACSLPQGFGPRVASMAHPTGAGWGGGEDCLRDS
jgi:hypothetical protein